ncbi:unnamed protein product, partial [Cylicostephanus goldi]
TVFEHYSCSGRVAHAKVKLSYTDFVTLEVGQRVLSCGEGEQLGHPGRTTTKKPRKVDIVEDEELQIVQELNQKEVQTNLQKLN